MTKIGARLSANDGKQLGGWTTFPFIIGTFLTLTITAGGWQTNLTVYLIEKYHVKSIDATQISNIILGCSNLIPVLGAIVADSMFGCFTVILFSSICSLLGVLLLLLTAILPSLTPSPCEVGLSCKPPSQSQYAALYAGVALGCIAIGGMRFTTAAMGADQFKRPKDQDTFFNWYTVALYLGSVIGGTVIVYTEDNFSWAWGYGICVALSLLGIAIFLMGNRYFFHEEPQGNSPFTYLAQVIVAAIRKMKAPLSYKHEDYYYGEHNGGKEESGQTLTKWFRFLNRAALITGKADARPENSSLNPWKLCTVKQVEDLKCILRILPLWLTSVVLSITIGSSTSFIVLQALITNRHLTPSFQIPAASLAMFMLLSVAIFLPIIDRLIYPAYKKLTNRYPTHLQRIGVGHAINACAMAVSAIIEFKRLKIVQTTNLKGPDSIMPMSALWLIPQLTLFGLGEAFHFAGHITFYYKEFPASLHATSTAMQAVNMGTAFYLSTVVIGLIRSVTDWLPNDLNLGRLDYFYWMLTIVAGLNFVCYLMCAVSYKYQNREEDGDEINKS